MLGAVANVTCNTGYKSVGNSSLQCQDTGWNGNVSCVIRDCGDPTPGNGLSQLPSGTTFGSSALLSCMENYTLTGASLVVCLDSGVWSELPACVRTLKVIQPEADADATFNIETTVVFGVAFGLIILVALVVLFICIYLKRCRQSIDKTDSPEENTFRGVISRHDHPDGFGPRSTYPSILTAHPPPAPPLKLSHKGNVNVVPPMTKSPSTALGVASVIPAQSHLNGNSHGDFSTVPEDTRRMQGDITRNVLPTNPRIHTLVDTLPHTSEITSPTQAINIPGASTICHQSSSNAVSKRMASNKNTQIVTEAQIEPLTPGAHGPISETSKRKEEVINLNEKHSEIEIVSKRPNDKTDIEHRLNKYPTAAGTFKTKLSERQYSSTTKQCHSQTYRGFPVKCKTEETDTNTENTHNPTVAPIHVPTATVEDEHSGPVDTTHSSLSFVKAIDGHAHEADKSQTSHTDLDVADQQEVDEFFDSSLHLDNVPSTFKLQNETPVVPLINRTDQHETSVTPECCTNNEESAERLMSSQDVRSRVASISSNTVPLMPSVESVLTLDNSSPVLENEDSVVNGTKYFESSDSEIEIPVPVGNDKDKVQEKKTIKYRRKPTTKNDKSTVTNAKTTRLLKSSYGKGTVSAGNVKPVAVTKETKSKSKQSGNDRKQIKQNTDMGEETDARLSKMSAIYRSKSPRKEIRKTPL